MDISSPPFFDDGENDVRADSISPWDSKSCKFRLGFFCDVGVGASSSLLVSGLLAASHFLSSVGSDMTMNTDLYRELEELLAAPLH